MKVFLASVGCRLNQAEMSSLGRQLHAAGHFLVADATHADTVIVNTCAVTREAARDSRALLHNARRDHENARIIATGCWATLQPRSAHHSAFEIVPNREKDLLSARFSGGGALPEAFDTEPLAREPQPDALQRTRAFVKAQDGCDNACTFCVTTIARGPGRSRPLAEIVGEIQQLAEEGFKEAVLTGVHLGSYGKDESQTSNLKLQTSKGLPAIGDLKSEIGNRVTPISHLIRAILRETDIPRLRLSSLEPWDLDDEFLKLWGEFPHRLCRHLHLPLQSGCADTLRRMNRNTSPGEFARLAASARAAIPDLTLTTDLIVGFPGEDEAEFTDSLAFVRELRFAGVHVFSYSPRPGTLAARMSGQVAAQVKRERNAIVRGAVEHSAREHRRRFVGRALPVLWEHTDRATPEGFRWSGLTDNYLRVETLSPEILWNTLTPATLMELTDGGLRGMIAND